MKERTEYQLRVFICKGCNAIINNEDVGRVPSSADCSGTELYCPFCNSRKVVLVKCDENKDRDGNGDV